MPKASTDMNDMNETSTIDSVLVMKSDDKSKTTSLTKKLFFTGLALPFLGFLPWIYAIYYGFCVHVPKTAPKDEESGNLGGSNDLEGAQVYVYDPEIFFAYLCLGGIIGETILGLSLTYILLHNAGVLPSPYLPS